MNWSPWLIQGGVVLLAVCFVLTMRRNALCEARRMHGYVLALERELSRSTRAAWKRINALERELTEQKRR